VISCKGEEVVNVGDFTEVRTDGIEEDELEENVSFNEVVSRLSPIAIEQIQILHGNKLMQPKFDHIPVNHLLIRLTNFNDLLLHLILENIIEVTYMLLLRHTQSVL